MANIDLYSIIEANANLAREKKELIRLVQILSQTIKEMATATELYSEGMTIEASQYRAMPKGFLASMLTNRKMVDGMTKRSRESAINVDQTMRDFAGGFDDATAAKAFYEALVDEMTRIQNKKNMNWFNAFRGPDGKWQFNPNDKNASEFYDKNKKQIDKFLEDINNSFPPFPFNKIDPNNYGGDLEGEWQDGQYPEEDE